MPVLVAIDVPPETPAEYTAAVAGSCNAALGEGTCIAGAGLPTTPPPEPEAPTTEEAPQSDAVTGGPPAAPPWVAVVRWDDQDYRTLRIELRPASEAPPVEARVVAFTPADPPRQRWASAGLVVAALVSRRETIPRPPPFGPPPQPTPRPEPAPTASLQPSGPPSTSPSQHPWARVDVGGVAGPGLDQGPVRLGGLLRVSVVPSALPLAVHAETRYSTRGGQPSVRWLDAALGATVRVGSWQSHLALELHADGVMQRLWLLADDPTRDQSDLAKRWRVGGRLGGDVVYEFASPAAFFIGLDASALRPEVIISISGDAVGNEPVVRWASSTGLRTSF